jgi:PAS domain S-box-containing protein
MSDRDVAAMSLYTLIPLLSCIASAVLATSILQRNSAHRANRQGALMVAGVSVWALCEVLWNSQANPETARVFLRLSALGWVFIGPLALDILLEITGESTPRNQRLLRVCYGISTALLAAAWFTPWMHTGMVPTHWGWGYEIGWLHPVFVAFTVACIGMGFRAGWRAYGTAAQGEKAQALYVSGGIAIPLLVASTTDGLLPLAGHQPIRLGTAAMTCFALSIAWAFYRYGYSLLAPGTFAQEILATLPTGVAMLRVDGRIRSVNGTMARLLGTRSEILVGTQVRTLLCGAEVDLRQEFSELECQMQAFDGPRVAVSLSATLLRDLRQDPIGLVLVVRDVTELAALRSSLVMSDRLAAVGELAAGIAHEINNPLAYVRSNLSLLRRHWEALEGEIAKTGTPEYTAMLLSESEEMIDESLQGVDRAVAICRDVRGLAHAAHGERENADVNALLDGVIRMAASQLKRTAAIVKDYDTILPLPCSPQELQQVFLNLVMNAGQAIDECGEIRVRTRMLDDAIVVSVVDDGCGIPPEMLERIFEPFFTTKAVGQGTGLGLGIALEIVRKHGGEMRVDSVLDEGTEFSVRLPVGADRMEPHSNV